MVQCHHLRGFELPIRRPFLIYDTDHGGCLQQLPGAFFPANVTAYVVNNRLSHDGASSVASDLLYSALSSLFFDIESCCRSSSVDVRQQGLPSEGPSLPSTFSKTMAIATPVIFSIWFAIFPVSTTTCILFDDAALRRRGDTEPANR